MGKILLILFEIELIIIVGLTSFTTDNHQIPKEYNSYLLWGFDSQTTQSAFQSTSMPDEQFDLVNNDAVHISQTTLVSDVSPTINSFLNSMGRQCTSGEYVCVTRILYNNAYDPTAIDGVGEVTEVRFGDLEAL